MIFRAVREEFSEITTLAFTSGSVWQTLEHHVTLHRMESAGGGSRGVVA